MEQIDQASKDRLHKEKLNNVLLLVGKELPSLKAAPFCWMFIVSSVSAVFFLVLLFMNQLRLEGEIFWFGGIALFYAVGAILLKKFVFNRRYNKMEDEIVKLSQELILEYLDPRIDPRKF